MVGTSLPRALIEAYLATRFRVLGHYGFVLTIGTRSHEAIRYLHANRTSGAAFVTAFNPFGSPARDDRNWRCQRRLESYIRGLGLRSVSAFGEDPEGLWPGEPSIFVPGLNRMETATLGRRFRQNAVVHVDLRGVPELLLLR